MITTSHFVALKLKSEILSDIYVKIYQYLKQNNIEHCVEMQNPATTHITLYYLDKEIIQSERDELSSIINTLDIKGEIYAEDFAYFHDQNGIKKILFIAPKTNLPLESFRNTFETSFKKNHMIKNMLGFAPHCTILYIKDSSIFDIHSENIEKITQNELEAIAHININDGQCNIYAVNSSFSPQVQIIV